MAIQASKKSLLSFTSQQQHVPKLDNFKKIMKNNKEWAKKCTDQDPDYFIRLVSVQKPKYLWIGCSDSRVPANEIMGLKPGQVFVHRNVANIASPADINVLAVIQYAVEHLRVEDIIVSGHYGCGGVKAAFTQNDFGPLQSWLSHVRELRSRFRDSLLGNQEHREDTLVELNVKQQVINVSRNSCVQQAWVRGQNLHIHGVVYNIQDGILKDLGLTTCRIQHVPLQYRIAKKQKQPKNNHNSQNNKQIYKPINSNKYSHCSCENQNSCYDYARKQNKQLFQKQGKRAQRAHHQISSHKLISKRKISQFQSIQQEKEDRDANKENCEQRKGNNRESRHNQKQDHVKQILIVKKSKQKAVQPIFKPLTTFLNSSMNGITNNDGDKIKSRMPTDQKSPCGNPKQILQQKEKQEEKQIEKMNLFKQLFGDHISVSTRQSIR